MTSEAGRRAARDVQVVDQELRLLAAVRTSTRELGGKPTSAAADQLLDERAAITTADRDGGDEA